MNKERFKNMREQMTPTDETINELYEKIEKEKSVRKSFSLKNISVIIACLALVFVIGIIPNIFHDGSQPQNPAVTSNQSAKEGKLFDGFILTAYAAEAENKYLTTDFQANNTATILTTDTKILLAKYNPAMSSVPGFPFLVEVNTEDTSYLPDNITITVDNGEILTWDQQTGKVSNHGKSFICNASETIYWSPLSSLNNDDELTGKEDIRWDNTNITTNAKITISAIKEGKSIGTQTIYIGESNRNYYAIVK